MAPRSTKANKKATDVKVVADVEPKKSRSRAKAVVEPELEPEDDVQVDEKVAIGKKAKPKRKGEGDEQENSNGDVPTAKKGRKKAVKEVELDDKDTEEANNDEDKPEQTQETEEVKPNGNGVAKEAEPALNGKGKKKPAKKADAKPTRGRKAKAEDIEDEEVPEDAPIEDKPAPEEKPKGRGRGRKPAAKPEKEEEEAIEETKPEPAAKGRKKAQPKAVKPPTPEPEIAEDEDAKEIADEEAEELQEKEKKETKSRKGKKAKEEKPANDAEPSSKKRKINKKEENTKVDSAEAEDDEEIPEEEEVKPAKGKRGVKKPADKLEDPEPQESESTTKRRRKVDNVEEDIKTKGPLKNKSITNYDAINFANTSQTPQGKHWNFKIASWNVDGIRAWFTKGGLDYIKHEKPDILCLQEVKCAKDKLPDDIVNLPGYHAYWLCSDKDGYAGVGIYTTKLAMNVTYGLQNEELDAEGRIITAEYEDFYLICTYVPNAGRKLVTLPKRLQWNEEFRKYVKKLDGKKPVIICGDMNVAHNEIDLANPKTNKKNAGFTQEERTGMSDLLSDGFVDTYRHFNPDKTGAYTFWTYMMNSRAKNVGWRLDYFLVSNKLVPSICDNVIRDEVYGSDHCPIALFLHLTSAEKPKE